MSLNHNQIVLQNIFNDDEMHFYQYREMYERFWKLKQRFHCICLAKFVVAASKNFQKLLKPTTQYECNKMTSQYNSKL